MIATIKISENGTSKIEFSEVDIFEVLKNTLGFGYITIDKKGYYLKKENDLYKVVSFLNLNQSFREYLKTDFSSLQLDSTITYEDLLSAFYKKSPIKNASFARKFLSKDILITEENRHHILLKTNPEYKNEEKRNEIQAFLTSEEFTETVDYIGNFYKNEPVFYKKVKGKKFVIISKFPVLKNAKQDIYDLWTIAATSSNDFLKRPTKKLTIVKKGFNLQRDLDLYTTERDS
ncbi:hypothetical protein [Flavobacterium sp. '19STA2R22 D10 B1']|uniref:hypothetical protein n=1 Tax=Flavobacterium aerium TaxID=3037261 RepID=UPI00278BD9C8|nr:hypothetical protein [Flavobacterium sp. '19STA2R22 D10 B1']